MDSKIKIGIIGLGLIGGSIEKCLKDNNNYELFCVSQSQNRPHKLEDLKDCDIVFLCGSQKKIKEDLREIAIINSKSGEGGTIPEDQRAFAKTLITDVGSTKEGIGSTAEELGLKNFIGGHPMAGTEHSGYDASFPELFQNCKWVLTTSNENFNNDKNLIDNLNKLETMIKSLGAYEIVKMDNKSHDEAVAAISHLSFVLSHGMANMTEAYPQANKVTGPSFKNMTRLANGNKELAKDLIVMNRENIKQVWETYKGYVDGLLDASAKDLKEELCK